MAAAIITIILLLSIAPKRKGAKLAKPYIMWRLKLILSSKAKRKCTLLNFVVLPGCIVTVKTCAIIAKEVSIWPEVLLPRAAIASIIQTVGYICSIVTVTVCHVLWKRTAAAVPVQTICGIKENCQPVIVLVNV